MKVRVKFLRNQPKNEMLDTALIDWKLIASIFTYNTKDSKNPIIKANGDLLASIIKKDFGTSENIINETRSILCQDVAELCLMFLAQANDETKTLENIKKTLEHVKKFSTAKYSSTLKHFVKSSVESFETEIIEERNKLYEIWLNERNKQLTDVLKTQADLMREEEIKNDINKINQKRQELWFFETQDQLDMEIFRKQVRYPKKWFGKKKKPRMADDNYVPPEIRTK